MHHYELEEGKTLMDTAMERPGVVMEVKDNWVTLRPIGGGREWEAHSEHLRPLTPVERQLVKLRATNRESATRPQ